jgi:hypothetical protein
MARKKRLGQVNRFSIRGLERICGIAGSRFSHLHMQASGDAFPEWQQCLPNGASQQSEASDRHHEQGVVPSLRHIAWIVEDGQTLNHGRGEKTYRCETSLPGEDGDPALDPAEKGTQLGRGVLGRPVILRASDWGAGDPQSLFSPLLINKMGRRQELTWKPSQPAMPQSPMCRQWRR